MPTTHPKLRLLHLVTRCNANAVNMNTGGKILLGAGVVALAAAYYYRDKLFGLFSGVAINSPVAGSEQTAAANPLLTQLTSGLAPSSIPVTTTTTTTTTPATTATTPTTPTTPALPPVPATILRQSQARLDALSLRHDRVAARIFRITTNAEGTPNQRQAHLVDVLNARLEGINSHAQTIIDAVDHYGV